MAPVWRIVVGAAVGAGVGFLLYRFVGCRTGACPLTGNPYVAMLIWGVVGAVMAAGK
ncbi:MAG: hypothetical protein KA248_06625 [Kiritimatiellae bacterium]|nr:hypothetical protein [Kiritimatiellia bacterium]